MMLPPFSARGAGLPACLFLFACCWITAAGAQAAAVPATVESALTEVADAALAKGDVVASAVVVVEDGRTVLSRGYGLADVASGRKATPDETAFRMTSVTKLLTAMAVMKLVDQGVLDLDADVNGYLDFRLRQDFAAPVTLRHLLTHTAGFEERSKDFYMPVGTALSDYVRTHEPRRIFPPGRSVSYSNYGYALAGRIVELAGGRPYERYIAEELFEPLGLAQASIAKPLPQPLLENLAGEYRRRDGAREPLRYLPDVPAGGLVATPTELARLVSAALFPAAVGARALSEAAAGPILDRQFSLHPEVSGVGFALRELRVRGQRVLYQGGDSCCHHTDVYVVPERRLVYVHSYSGGNRRYRGEMWRAFAAAALGAAPPASADVSPAATPGTDADPSGKYLLTRRAERSMFSLLYVFSNQIEVQRNSDGSVIVPALLVRPDGGARPYYPLGNGVYEERDDRNRIAFLTGADGRIERLAGGGLTEAHRIAPWQDSRVIGGLLLAGVAVFVVTLLGALVGRLRRGRARPAASRWISAQRRAMRWTSAAALAFLGIFFGFALKARDELALLSADYDPLMRAAQLLALLTIFGTVVVLAATLPAFRESTVLARLRMLAQGAAAVYVSALILAFHVLQRAVYY